MKKQNLRMGVQLLGLILTMIGFFISFKWTMALIMVLMVIGGTFYCGWLCPYGSIQEFANKLARKLKIKQRRMPKHIHKYLKYMRYLVLITASVLSFSIIFELLALDPRNAWIGLLTGHVPSVLAVIVLVVFTLLAMVYDRFFCQYLCYEGAKYGIMSLLRPATIRRDSDKCINCKKCDKVCPMSIEVSTFEVVRSPACINCFKCTDICPVEETLNYGFKSKKIKRSILLAVFAIALVLIPTAFLLEGTNTSDAINVDAFQDLTHLESEPSDLSGIKVDISENESESQQVSDVSDAKAEVTEAHQNNQVDPDKTTTETITTKEDTTQSEEETIVSQVYTDGTYTGVGKGFRDDIYVQVTLVGDQITEILVTQHRDDRKWYNRAEAIIEDMLSSQSTDVDLIGGATYSSKGIRDAVVNALEKAK